MVVATSRVTNVNWASYSMRAKNSVVYGIVFGVALALLRQQNIWITLVYSVSISIICWICIDLGRTAVAHWKNYGQANCSVPGSSREAGWPGWPWMLGIIMVGSVIGISGGTAFGDWATGNRSLGLSDVSSLREAVSMLLFGLIPAVALTYFFYSRGVIADREAATLGAQRQAAESRLKLLESQIEPHMLFNTLANLRVLIALDPPRAQVMLDQLISFLRATLSGSRDSAQTLRAEFDRLGDYLALIKVRMADRLTIKFDLPESLAAMRVPPLLLQPLVENSIKHGLEPALAGGRIDISASCESNALVLCVRDTGVGIDSSVDSTAFGLAQVRGRLATQYGANASLQLLPNSELDGGTLAIVRLPMTVA